MLMDEQFSDGVLGTLNLQKCIRSDLGRKGRDQVGRFMANPRPQSPRKDLSSSVLSITIVRKVLLQKGKQKTKKQKTPYWGITWKPMIFYRRPLHVYYQIGFKIYSIKRWILRFLTNSFSEMSTDYKNIYIWRAVLNN